MIRITWFRHYLDHALLAIAALIVLLSTPLSAQPVWEHLTEPFGGSGTYIFEIEDGILLGTKSSGMRISHDDGQTWEWYGTDKREHTLGGVLSDGTLIAYSYRPPEIVRLTDNGDSVGATGTGLSGLPLAVTVASNDNIFATTDRGIYISSDGARTWEPAPIEGAGSNKVQLVATRDTRVLVSAARGLWYSDDAGATFSQLSPPIGTAGYSAVFTRSGDILLGVIGGLYKSRDSGRTFEHFVSLPDVTPYFRGEIAESEAGDFWVPDFQGRVHRVASDALSVDPIPFPTAEAFGTYLLSSNTLLITDRGNGVWRSEDYGETYVQTGIPFTGLSEFFSDISTGRAGEVIVGTPFGAAISSDAGDSWVRLDHLQPSSFGPAEIFTNQTMLRNGRMIATAWLEGGLFRWSPAGTVDYFFDERMAWIDYLVEDSNGVLLMVGNPTSLRSTDGGTTWEERTIYSLEVAVDRNGRIWSARSSERDGVRIDYSDDGWATSSSIVVDFDNRVRVYPLPGGGILVSGQRGTSPSQVHDISTDNGQSWRTVKFPCTNQYSWLATVRDLGGGPGLALVIPFCGTYLWDVDRNEWEKDSLDLPDEAHAVSTMTHNGEYLFISTATGLLRSRDKSVSLPDGVSVSEKQPFSVRYGQGAFSVSLSEKIQGDVTLSVYDVRGQQIASLPAGVVRNARHSTIRFVLGQRLASGHYVLRLSTSSGVIMDTIVPVRVEE